MDHLQSALLLKAQFGDGNLIYAQGAFWCWKETGVWRKLDDVIVRKAAQQLLARVQDSVSSGRIRGMVDCLMSEVAISDHLFNVGDTEMVNCPNGHVALINGVWQLTPHRKEDYRTTQIPVAFDPDAKAPEFTKFLNEIFGGDPDGAGKIQALLEMMGYALMSHALHEKFVILIGVGANGKSVVLSVIEALCGSENVAAVQPTNFGNTFQRAFLNNKLANIITELGQGKKLADAELKSITSGEPTTVEHKHREPFQMRPYATCFFATNHMPSTSDFSDALFRRAVILKFNRVFKREEQDPRLKVKLKKELPGILLMALNSYARALTHGFTDTSSMDGAKREWRFDANQVSQFVEDCCKPSAGSFMPISLLYRKYKEWATIEGIAHTLTKNAFSVGLTYLGFEKKRTSSERGVVGLVLNPNMSPG